MTPGVLRSEPEQIGCERRAARRWTLPELPWPVTCRITPGRHALIVNLSAVGMLIESDEPLAPGRDIVVHLLRPGRRATLEGTVVRSFVSAVSARSGTTFRAAVAFRHWFEPWRELDSRPGSG